MEASIRKCLRCAGDLQEVWLNQALSIEEKSKNVLGFFKSKKSDVQVYVCSSCGQIDLAAQKPERFNPSQK